MVQGGCLAEFSESNVARNSEVWMFLRYLRRFFEMRRRDPQNDLATALITAEEAGDKLSRDELLAMVFLLLIAGHETTVNLIGNGVLALFEHPEDMAQLRQNPTLIKTAVEELLRYTSPVFMLTERYAREDVTIHGVTIPRGEMTLGVIGSANRDERVFNKPDQLWSQRYRSPSPLPSLLLYTSFPIQDRITPLKKFLDDLIKEVILGTKRFRREDHKQIESISLPSFLSGGDS